MLKLLNPAMLKWLGLALLDDEEDLRVVPEPGGESSERIARHE